MSRPCTPRGRDRGTFPNVAGPARPPACRPRDAGAAAIGHADRPDQVERKTTEYPSRERGVKAGPGWPGPVCTQSAARPYAWQEGTPARRSPPPARRYPDCPSSYYRTQTGLPGFGWRRALFTSATTRSAWTTFPPADPTACDNAGVTNVQVRDVPEAVLAALKQRATAPGHQPPAATCAQCSSPRPRCRRTRPCSRTPRTTRRHSRRAPAMPPLSLPANARTGTRDRDRRRRRVGSRRRPVRLGSGRECRAGRTRWATLGRARASAHRDVQRDPWPHARGSSHREAGARAVRRLERVVVTSLSCGPMLDRMWQLKDDLTGYDAAYAVAAELLGVPLVTGDRRLAAAPGLRCPVVVPI